MFRTSRNFVVAYVLLVGLPIFTLIGVLKFGRGISAPMSIDGTWNMQSISSNVPASCASLASPTLRLSVSQSGLRFTWNLTDHPSISGSGTIDGTRIKALGTSDPSCLTARNLQILADAEPASVPQALNGTISFSDCHNCGSITFRSAKQPALTPTIH